MSLSLGKSKSKSTSQEQSTSTNTLDPRLAATLYGNIGQAQAVGSRLQPYTGQRVAGFNATQGAAQSGLLNFAQSGAGRGLLGEAATYARNAATAQPLQVNGTGYTAAQARPVSAVGYQPAGVTGLASASAGAAAQAQASQINRGDVRDLSSGAVSRQAIDAYMNPYQDAVVATSLADIERQRAVQESLNNAAARKAGAFGGTGAAVAAALGNETFARQAAQTAAELRSRSYESALAAAQGDAGRALDAQRANQQADLGVATSNAGFTNAANLENMRAANQRAEYDAGLDQQGRLANADAANRAALANAQNQLTADQFNADTARALSLADATSTNEAARFGATQDFEAQRLNQSAGQQAQQLGLAAAQQLASLSDQERDQLLQDLSVMGSVGDAQQGQVQRELDAALAAHNEGLELTLKQQELLSQAIALLPTYGTTTNTGTATSTGKGTSVGAGVSFGR